MILSDEKQRIERRASVVDMMLTAHCVLRDRLKRRWFTLEIVTILSSAVLCATTFFDEALLEALGIRQVQARLVIGSTSLMVFMASLLQLLVKWPSQAEKHAQSAARLSQIKADYRAAIKGIEGETLQSEALDRLSSRADEIMRGLEPIPDDSFLELKAIHRRKVAISTLIDQHPGAPVWLLRWRLWWMDTRTAWRGANQ